jgi:hypothetical protein
VSCYELWSTGALQRHRAAISAELQARDGKVRRLRPPPAAGTARWRERQDDLALARRALEYARGGEVLLLRNAIDVLERGSRDALTRRERNIARHAAARAGAES